MANRDRKPRVTAIVFDLGGVLMDWNPRHLYRKLFDGDEKAMERFLATICTAEWIRQQDMGMPITEAVARLAKQFPDQAPMIAAYEERWGEMLAGPIEGTASVLPELRQQDVPIYGLTNMSAEKFPSLRERLGFLEWFEAVVVSGAVGVAKPDQGIYRHLVETHQLDPASTVYVDDVMENVEGAMELGFIGLHFETASGLREDLANLSLL